MDIDAPNPRASRRRSCLELVRAVRGGRRIAESLRTLDMGVLRAEEDRLLAAELARFLVRRCEREHAGWRVLRQVLLDGGAEITWERCARLAYAATAARVLSDCARPGRTPLLRVQHAAAEERARALVGHADQAQILDRLKIVPGAGAGPGAWERALVGAVTARSREQAIGLLAAGVGGAGPPPGGGR
jgi:hypothetical protein